MVVETETSERFTAANLGAVLRDQGRFQRWLARQVGVSESLISYVIRGERTLGKREAERISQILGVPFFLLFDLRYRSENGTNPEVRDAD